MDYVELLGDVTITVTTRERHGYVVEAAVPQARLGVRLREGLQLAGDFGATHAGPDGQRTKLRTYWSNQATGIVDDVVFELKLEPANWGRLRFEK